MMKKLITSFVALSLVGCASIPENLLSTSPKSLERRQVEARKFTGLQETTLLTAVGGVIQDLGFTLEGSETKLGLIVANKNRDATQTGEVVAAVLIALLGGGQTAISRDQKIRVSVVVLPTADKVKDSWQVRATFQRIVTRTDNTQFAETLEDPKLHTELFEKLSKAVFLEAQKI
jgi:hypothetical protein